MIHQNRDVNDECSRCAVLDREYSAADEMINGERIFDKCCDAQ